MLKTMMSRINNHNRLRLSSSLSTLLLASCGSGTAPLPTVLDPQNNQSFAEHPGVWIQKGTGLAFEIDENTVSIYQYTRKTCIENGNLSIKEADNNYIDIQSKNSTSLSFIEVGSSEFNREHFERLDHLPKSCINLPENPVFNPKFIFEHFWHSFNDYYAFFKERNVNWQAQYDRYSANVNDDTLEDELFSVLSAMIEVLNDGHVNLYADTDTYENRASSATPKGFELYAENLADKNNSNYEDEYFGLIDAFTEELEEQYAVSAFNSFTVEDTYTLMTWGLLKDNVGYLQINAMEYFLGEEYTEQEQLSILDQTISTAIEELNNTDSLIIDVRFNEGGTDSISLHIASRFTDKMRLAYRKQAYNIGYLTPPVEYFTKPHDDEPPYSKPITLIAGPNTASAAEIFIYAMQALPHVIHIGEPSDGVHSDILDVSLFEGWTVGLSHEIYSNPQGSVYEVTGIPPQIEVPVTKFLTGDADLFPAIELALNKLNK